MRTKEMYVTGNTNYFDLFKSERVFGCDTTGATCSLMLGVRENNPIANKPESFVFGVSGHVHAAIVGDREKLDETVYAIANSVCHYNIGNAEVIVYDCDNSISTVVNSHNPVITKYNVPTTAISEFCSEATDRFAKLKEYGAKNMLVYNNYLQVDKVKNARDEMVDTEMNHKILIVNHIDNYAKDKEWSDGIDPTLTTFYRYARATGMHLILTYSERTNLEKFLDNCTCTLYVGGVEDDILRNEICDGLRKDVPAGTGYKFDKISNGQSFVRLLAYKGN